MARVAENLGLSSNLVQMMSGYRCYESNAELNSNVDPNTASIVSTRLLNYANEMVHHVQEAPAFSKLPRAEV